MPNTTASSPSTPDAVKNSWVNHAPTYARPYLRLMRADRPIGTWLLLIPCFWGSALAAAQGAGGLYLFWHAALFSLGAFVMRAAGCTYNDIVDKDFDARVERTAARPIPAGEVSIGEAWTLLVGLCLIGLAVLLQFNLYAIVVGVSSLALIAAYPFMKRVTYWPQAWLGLTFNWGVLVAYAAAAGGLSTPAVILYAAGFFWTLGYDTIYAHQDTEDDALIGVKSTALKFGNTTPKWMIGFYTTAIVLFTIAGLAAGFGFVYYLALIPAAAHFALQIRKLDITNAHNCLILFKSNREAGLLLLLAPLAETIVRLI